MMKRLSRVIPGLRCSLIFLALTLSYCTTFPQSGKTVRIFEVVDGDTFLAESNGIKFKVRLFGIDCPEGDQPGGELSTAYLQRYLNKNVVLVEHGHDKYNRVLGDIYLGKEFINLKMVQDGVAWHYKKYSDSRLLAAAEDQARANKVGLWKEANPIAPWDWREAIRSAGNQQNKRGVYICSDEKGTSYHSKPNCFGLLYCSGTVKLLSEKSAQAKGIKKCRLCFK